MKPIAQLVFYLIFAFVGAQEGKPSAKPRNVKVEMVSDSSLRVTWSAPDKSDWNGETSGYLIEYSPSASDPRYSSFNFKRSFCKQENCSFELNYLNSLTEYTIAVSVRNSMGTGPRSNMVNQTTALRKPYIPPRNINCKPISSTELHLKWESPPQQSINGIFKGFKVSYAPSYLFVDDENKEHNITMDNEMVLHGLKKSLNYAITVLASNSAGDGIQSEAIYCSTEEDVPDEPIDVKVLVYGTEKVLISWHAPLEANGQILHYTIYHQKSGSEAKSEKVLPSQTSYEIFGLEANEPYDFWVTASSILGEGLASVYLTGMLSNETPPKIATYNDTFSYNFQSNISLPCEAVGSPMPNVTWKVNGDNLIQNERMQILANGTLIIQSVVREDDNNYTCIATNVFGNDSITHNLIIFAPPKSPKVTILSTTTDAITLEVKPNSTDSAPFYGFILQYKLDSKIEDWQDKNLDADSQSYKIEHCKCGSPYQIYAFGYNYYGNGDASEILTVRTNGSKPIAPTMSDFIEPSVDSVTLNFSSWRADSCPISHFFVEFKEKKNIRWVKIRNKLRPNINFVLNLGAGTLYDIRVTAHNAAGATKADYFVETLIEHGTVAPPSNITELSKAEETIKQIETKL